MSPLAVQGPQAPPTLMRHTQSLDGIRAIAVFMVMCFHYGYFAPGWIGVQIFFTLSGYLITAILLREREQPFRTYILRFYWHRAVRILPLVLLFLALAALFFLITGTPKGLPSDWLWVIGFLTNCARLRPQDVDPAYLHLWSLAVEQQFYLLWPLFVYFLSPKSFRTLILAILILTPLVRLVTFAVIMSTTPDSDYAGKAIYVLTFTQLDAFAAGAAIAVFSLERVRRPLSRLVIAIVCAGILGLAVLVSAYTKGLPAFKASLGYAMFLLQGYGYVWAYSVLNVISTLLIICAIQPTILQKLLASSVLARVGRISFGIYVYHVPLLLLARAIYPQLFGSIESQSGVPLFLLWGGVVLITAQLSFSWWEVHFLRLKDHFIRSDVGNSSRNGKRLGAQNA